MVDKGIRLQKTSKWAFFYLYYDLGVVVIRLRFAAPRQEPRDDIEKPARVGGGVVSFSWGRSRQDILFCFLYAFCVLVGMGAGLAEKYRCASFLLEG